LHQDAKKAKKKKKKKQLLAKNENVKNANKKCKLHSPIPPPLQPPRPKGRLGWKSWLAGSFSPYGGGYQPLSKALDAVEKQCKK
jgi:hypothetical protein